MKHYTLSSHPESIPLVNLTPRERRNMTMRLAEREEKHFKWQLLHTKIIKRKEV